jgi:Ca2+-binding RTX toxin-like protein
MPKVRTMLSLVTLATVFGTLAVGSRSMAGPMCFGRSATIVSNAGTINGTSGNDVIVGGSGINFINGRGGNDRICSRANEETIRGGGGNDKLDGGRDNDAINGGRGRDRVAFASESFVNIDLRTGFAINSSDDTISSIENVTGTVGHDTIRGDREDNGLDGGEGRDQITGRGGHDRISGGRAADTLVGSGGRDRLNGGPGPDTGNGGPGNDTCQEIEKPTDC